MKRKIISFILIFTLIITAMPFTGIDFSDVFSLKASAAEETENFIWGDYECRVINTNEVEIALYSGTDTEVIIPSEINGMPVTSIGEYSFSGGEIYTKTSWIEHPNAINNKNIQKLVIPSSVKTIGAEAFSFIDSLSEVVLNEGLESIGEFAFADCPLLTEITLPESFSDFDFTSFENTGIEELTFGSNLTHLELLDFERSVLKKIICNAECVNLEIININGQNTDLSELVFNGTFTADSESFKSIGNINKIESRCGADYHTVVRMAYEDFYPRFNSDGSITFTTEKIAEPEQFEEDGFRYFINENSQAVITQYVGEEENVVVPETLGGNYTVTGLGNFSFSNFYYKASLSHSQTLIKSIILPDTIKEIGICAFASNISLENINIPKSLTVIPKECFYNCKTLNKIVIPDNIECIDEGAFYNCEKLKSISISEKIKEIKKDTFRYCSELETIEMPGVKKIKYGAFYSCTKLSDEIFSENITEIGDWAFFGCKSFENIDLSSVTHLGERSFYSCNGLDSVILNDRIEHLAVGVFANCLSLDTVHLPSDLISIGGSCFMHTDLTEIIFGEHLKAIGAGAFSSCGSLSNVVFSDSLESIGNGAFRCSGLESVTIPENVKILGRYAFSRSPKLTTLYFNAIDCYVADNGEHISSENVATSSPFYATKITNIYFGSNVTAVNNKASLYGTFEGNESLESVTIPNSVEVIGTAAFKNCSNLETAVISDSVTEIADDAFEGCDNLIIYCSETSYAFAYASAQGIRVSTFIIEAIPNQTYTGSKIEPKLSVSVSNGKLSENIDYSVSYSNNINAGEAKVRITGIGDYDKFASVASFTIVTRSISSAKVADVSAQNYTGKEIKPSLVITYNGKVLKEGTDYKLQYFNNKSIGAATVYIVGIGNFSGTDSVNFSIEDLSPTQIFLNALISFFNSFFARFAAILN